MQSIFNREQAKNYPDWCASLAQLTSAGRGSFPHRLQARNLRPAAGNRNSHLVRRVGIQDFTED
jgi:hypothetical protein